MRLPFDLIRNYCSLIFTSVNISGRKGTKKREHDLLLTQRAGSMQCFGFTVSYRREIDELVDSPAQKKKISSSILLTSVTRIFQHPSLMIMTVQEAGLHCQRCQRRTRTPTSRALQERFDDMMTHRCSQDAYNN